MGQIPSNSVDVFEEVIRNATEAVTSVVGAVSDQSVSLLSEHSDIAQKTADVVHTVSSTSLIT